LYSQIKGRTLKVFKNRVPRTVFVPMREEVTSGWKNCIMNSFVVCKVKVKFSRHRPEQALGDPEG
jgi:hypothetical protein